MDISFSHSLFHHRRTLSLSFALAAYVIHYIRMENVKERETKRWVERLCVCVCV
uniref:Uncharacterized protein n=1 Tax=Octopus bimaculoides TaxID=37653 RepID=A0A0L8G3W8_OCTBM